MKSLASKNLNLLVTGLVCIATACGDDASPGVVGSNNTSNNANNTATNNANNTATNNATNNANNTANNTTNNTTNNANNTANNTTNNSTNNTNNTVIEGTAKLVAPQADTIYANDLVLFEAEATGDAQGLQLIRDETEVVAEFGDSVSVGWDVSSVAEGSYKIQLQYFLLENLYWAEGFKTVVVDHTAPEIDAATPAPGTTDASPNAQITISFSEPLNPASVNANTVKMQIDDQSIAATPTLSADGKTIELDFDRASYGAPYQAKVIVDGVLDMAGNAVQADLWTYDVPAYLGDSFTASLTGLKFASVGGVDYIVGYVAGTSSDTIEVYANRNGTWVRVGQQTFTDVAAFDVDPSNDRLHIAALVSDNISGTPVRAAQLLQYDPATNALTLGGKTAVGPITGNAAIAVDIDGNGAALGVIAAVSNEKIYTYEFINGGLSLSSTNTWDQTATAVRDESLDIERRDDNKIDLTYAHTIAANYTATTIRRWTRSNNGWTQASSSITNPDPSGSCDIYQGFDTAYVGSVQKLVYAYYGPCTNASTTAYLRSATATGWDSAGNYQLQTVLGDQANYKTSIAVDGNGDIYLLFASPKQLEIAKKTATGLEVLPAINTGLTPGNLLTNQYRFANIGIDANGLPAVSFRFSNRVYTWYMNQ